VAKVGILADPAIDMSEQVMGNLDAVFLLSYAVGQFIWGMMGDKYGARRVVAAGLFFSVVAAVAMGCSTLAWVFGALMAVQGLCQASGWAPLSKNLTWWFARRERGRVFGFWLTSYAFGGLVASPFAGYMAGRVFGDWRYSFFASAAVVAVVWVLFLVFQRNRPENVGLPPIETYKEEEPATLVEGEPPDDEPEGSWKVIGEVLRHPVVLLLGLVYFLQKPARYAILLWGPVFVSRRLHTDDMAVAGTIAAAFELAGLAAPIVAGYLSDKVFGTRRIPVCVIGLLALSVVLFLFDTLTATGNVWMMVGILFLIGFLFYGPESIVSGTAAVDFGTKRGASTAAGFINGCGSVGAILGGLLPGYIKDEGILFYGFAGAILLSALILIPLWNARPRTGRK
jgi:sugar phosphate permease